MYHLQAVRPLHGAAARLSALAAAQLFRRHVGHSARRQTPPAAAATTTLSRRHSGVCIGRPFLGSSQTGPHHPVQRTLRGAAGVRSLHAHIPQQEEDPPQDHRHQPGGSLQVRKAHWDIFDCVYFIPFIFFYCFNKSTSNLQDAQATDHF